MFVTIEKIKPTKGVESCVKLKSIGLASAITLVSAMTFVSPSFAADAPEWKQKRGDIPVVVTLTDVVPASKSEGKTGGPIYVSIQTRKDYSSMKGFGGVIKAAEAGVMTATHHVDTPGEYAVSIWHDRDDDGRFSMTDSYEVLDSWGASGTPPTDTKTTFDDVKISVPNMGTNVTINMVNPN